MKKWLVLLGVGNEFFLKEDKNVLETEVTVSISIVSSFGDVVFNNITAVLPRRAAGITADFAFPGRCRFNFSGAPNAIRATGWTDSSGAMIDAR